ncbi:MAG: phenylalanine--tRNA ligase subunit beta [Candidatus Pacearchaeota archaeon]
MAILTLNRSRFEREIGKLDEKLQNKIAMFGTPIESINEKEICIEISPNRPDLLSYSGYKRTFLSFLGKKTGLKEYKLNPPQKDYEVIIDPSVKEVRPYTACAIVKGLAFNDERIKEIIEMQEKLHVTLGRKRKKVAIGIYPLEKIKLPITFKAIEPDKIKFVPLESEKELSGLEILQKHPTGKEYAHLLAGKAKFPVFMDADNKILSMPPIINSKETGKVTNETKDVFIECSGLDFETAKYCINIITTALAEMGGAIYQMVIRHKRKELTPNLTPEKMKISLENVNRLLGLSLKEKELKILLERMGYNYSNGVVEIPAWRIDILHEVDIIEDVAIAYGYENFTPIIPNVYTIGSTDKNEITKSKIAEILVGLGMIEVLNYHIIQKKEIMEKMEEGSENFIEIEKSKTDFGILRNNLSYSLLKNLSENVDSEYPQEIFELGRVFIKNGNKIKEIESLAIAVSPGNYTRIKQIMEYLLRMLNIEIKLNEPERAPHIFIDGRVGQIFFNEKKIGYIGEIHPRILKNWRIKMPVAIFEIEIDDILKELVK